MNNFFQTIENFGNRMRTLMTPVRMVLLGNMLLVVVLISLSNLHVFPLRLWDFIFFFLLFLLVALYRSGWVFGLFVGMLPLEMLNLAPLEFGINLRPYQLLAIVLLVAIFIRLMTRRIAWPFFTLSWHDGVMGLFLLSGFLMIPFLPATELASVALKQSVILISFGLIYLLGRIFLKKESDLRIVLSFFLSSMAVVLVYSLWQSVRFKWGLPDYSVMTGRPNGTFPEADFLGGVLAAIGACMVPFGLHFFFQKDSVLLQKILFFLFFLFISLILILTVARSGWLAMMIGMVFSGILFFWRYGVFESLLARERAIWWRGIWGWVFIGMPIALSILVVIFFRLTAFDLLDRGASVSSGLQKITVSCGTTTTPAPARITRIEELEPFGCRHINLEEISSERMAGHVVTEVFRDDPNIHVRMSVYREAWALIGKYPITGIGWGNASHFFGVDGRGSGMNASNVFLQIWLEGGLLSIVSFGILWCSFLLVLVRESIRESTGDRLVRSFSLLAIWVSLTVFNTFNAGLLLGSFWLLLSVFVWHSRSLDIDSHIS